MHIIIMLVNTVNTELRERVLAIRIHFKVIWITHIYFQLSKKPDRIILSNVQIICFRLDLVLNKSQEIKE